MAKRSKKGKKKTVSSKVVVDNTRVDKTKSLHDPNLPIPYHQKMIKFSAGQHDTDGCWGWKKICTHTFFSELFNKIINDYQSMRYCDLIDHKKKSHAIALDDEGLNKEAIKRLQELGLHHRYDELVSIRVSGKKRLWCTHDENVLNILWWDPEHEIYPSKKK